NLMCQFETSWNNTSAYFEELPDVIIHLQEMQNDGLLTVENKTIRIQEKGKPFIRNICMAFDLRLKRKIPENQLFSMTI
ncbi:MAG TPA: coproporphyrinogen III oxidase, partial [Flavobacterium sp.]|nr:coproporphyrinogen III oxidase [Flavobacterium sp.]